MNRQFSKAFQEAFGRALTAAANLPPLPPDTPEQIAERERQRQQREIEREKSWAKRDGHRRSMWIAKSNASVAKRLGVSPAGLSYLARLLANPAKATKRGTEHLPLVRDGYVQWRWGEDKSYSVLAITDAGREIVRRARAMGW